MAKEHWKIKEIIEEFEIDPDFILELEEEEIICPVCEQNSADKRLSIGDMERLRLAKILFEEMEVNLPGIEVILQMRQNMLNMRKQFDEILEDLARRIKSRFGEDF